MPRRGAAGVQLAAPRAIVERAPRGAVPAGEPRSATCHAMVLPDGGYAARRRSPRQDGPHPSSETANLRYVTGNVPRGLRALSACAAGSSRPTRRRGAPPNERRAPRADPGTPLTRRRPGWAGCRLLRSPHRLRAVRSLRRKAHPRGRPPDPRAGLRPFPLQFVVVDPPVAFPAPAQECGCLAIDEQGRREAFSFRSEADTD